MGTVYTDGACSAGVGGWAILLDGELASGWLPGTTNNQMELYAIYQAIEHCPSGETLEIFTDSKLCIGWLQYHWIMRKVPIAVLVGLILEVASLKGIRLRFTKVKGHAGNPGNHLVDRAAVIQSKVGYSAMLARSA